MADPEVIIERDGLFPHYYFFCGLEQPVSAIVLHVACFHRSKPLFEGMPS